MVGHFNSHAHVERDQAISAHMQAARHFNSHAHVERDGRVLKCPDSMNISTHTLTWSVTDAVISVGAFSAFQLTRSRGA